MIVDAKMLVLPNKGDLIAIGNNDPHASFKEHVSAVIRGEHTSYQTGRDQARATGLWIWDYVKEHGGSINAAVLKAKKHPIILKWYGESSERVLQRHHTGTRECIKKGVVLRVSDL